MASCMTETWDNWASRISIHFYMLYCNYGVHVPLSSCTNIYAVDSTDMSTLLRQHGKKADNIFYTWKEGLFLLSTQLLPPLCRLPSPLDHLAAPSNLPCQPS